MARKNPLPAGEIEICRRLREARQRSRLSQVAVARLIGMDRARLASYEHARVPLPYAVFLAVQKIFFINPRWLATGQTPRILPDSLGYICNVAFGDRQLFSEVFDKLLSTKLTQETIIAAPDSFQDLNEFANDELRSLESIDIRTLREDERRQVQNQIRFARKIIEREVAFSPQKSKGADLQPNLNLTDAANYGKLPEVKPALPKLLERLQHATADTGKRSELAAWLHVPLASVSRWLSGKREPGGEITLRLLQWVEQQERQK